MRKFLHIVGQGQYALFALVGATVVLWQMLLPGYVLTLDMVFGPHALMPSYTGLSAAAFPASYVLYLLQFVFGGWMLQKIVLFSLFFLLFYLPLRFYPFTNAYGEAYVVSLLYAVNPFVYERLLAGQWKVLMAYAFLFPLVSCLTRWYAQRSWRQAIWAAVWLLLMAMFSLHIFVMGVFVMVSFSGSYCVYLFLRGEYMILRRTAITACLTGVVLCAASVYWIWPALHAPTLPVDSFSVQHWDAFKTASDKNLGTLGNVAALYGFWGERELWSASFITPKQYGWWWGSGLGLLLLVLLGLIRGITEPKVRFFALWAGVVGICAIIFAAGVGDSVVQSINTWLFEHLWFWRGFRDTQKWSGVLALVYALFVGMGAHYLMSLFEHYPKTRTSILIGLCLLPLLYTSTMLFGFSNQLRPVQYPAVWHQANEVLKNDLACVVVFLPWHQYYTPVFNHRILTANTAPRFFDCEVISSSDAEIGEVREATSKTPAYYALAATITSNTNSAATIETMRERGVRYIIFTNDEAAIDPYTYPFLKDPRLSRIVDTPTLVLFRIY